MSDGPGEPGPPVCDGMVELGRRSRPGVNSPTACLIRLVIVPHGLLRICFLSSVATPALASA